MDERTPIRLVLPVIEDVKRGLVDACLWLEVGGSVRRLAPEVKDVELVAIARHGLLARLDKWVAIGKVHKALYGKAMLQRWGPKYRGFVYRGVRFELFTTDPDSLGYIFWLRTGPADANLYVMDRLLWSHAPFRVDDGALWHDDRRLHVPDEREFFRLIGMPYIIPERRSINLYRQFMGQPNYPPPATYQYAAVQVLPKSNQPNLF